MKKHEFYKKYANTPVGDRFVVLDFIEHGDLTLGQIYEFINSADKKIADLEREIQFRIDIAEPFLKKRK